MRKSILLCDICTEEIHTSDGKVYFLITDTFGTTYDIHMECLRRWTDEQIFAQSQVAKDVDEFLKAAKHDS